jgi:RHS repeat-associated protein
LNPARVLTAGLVLALVALLAPAAHAAPRKAANLKVASLANPPSTLRAGETLGAKVKVRNAGRRKARASRIALVLSRDKRRDARDARLGTLRLKALKPRKRATAAGRVTVPATLAAGSYRLLACADAQSKVKETSEKDNCRVAGRALAISGPSPAPSPGPAPSGPPARPTPGTENIPPGPGPGPGTPPPGPGEPPPKPDPIPVDPGKVAPKLDPGASTSVHEATRFLYTGANPIQRGVEAGAIDEDQVAVLRGRVADRVGEPIKGVRVSVVDHPELGMTNTRADGAFDLAVNGGAVTLSFEIAGFLPVQRALSPDWQDYETLTEVVMVPVDPNVEVIDPDSNAAFQVVQGTESQDQDGARQGTLLFPRGVEGEMELPGGRSKPLDEMSVRVTEFTYGSQGDEAMPGSLPATTGYTYAAEFSVDEALKAGATEVRFDKPVINYTENFIGAPVGSPVPTGFYDREKGEWVPSENGRVIEVVDEAGGRAGVDVDGDGAAEPAGSPKLAELDLTDAERTRLASLYEPGQELWRVQITHFTPWDHNWPYGPPPGARPPKLKEFEWQDPNDPCRQKGSEIGCETQTLGESVPVTGTGMTLNYSSDRTPGWRVDETLDIPIVGPSVPERLKGVQLLIDVAGERIEKRWCDPNYATTGAQTCKDLPLIEPNTSFAFRWDGLDAYDRRIQGRITATIQVLYVYEFNYYESRSDFASSFSQFGSDSQVFDGRGACGNRAGNMDSHFFCGIPIGQTITRAIGSWDARPTHGLGGWSLSEHHAYDPLEGALHRGDGASVRAEAMPAAVQTIAGTTRRGVGGGPESANFPKEGEPAAEANLDYMGDYVRSPDGNLYLHNGLNRNHIFRIGRDDKVYLFAGNGSKLREHTGDGGPAKQAALGVVSALAAAADGSLLIAGYTDDSAATTIRRVSPDGSRIETIAGTLNRSAPFGDGKPALEAHIGNVNDMVAAPDGSIYWTERYSQLNGWKGRVRRIGQDGIVTTVIGAGAKLPENGNAAAESALGSDPQGLALGPDGSIYVAVPYTKQVIRIAPDGRTYRFAGKGVQGERGRITFGAQAAESYIDSPYSVAAAQDGSVYIRSLGYDVGVSAATILRVNGAGVLEHYAGRLRGTCGTGADGEAAPSVCMQNHSRTIGVDGDGGLTYADGRYRIRKVKPPLPGFDADTLALPSADGLELYEFDQHGRHLRTRDGLTGAIHRTFEYDAAKRLIGIADAFGNRTRIERDAAGTALAIVAPGGQRTALGMAGGWLETVTNPAAELHRFAYHPGGAGLLASYRRPEGGTTHFDYDASGRLTRHRGADGEQRTLERTEHDGGFSVAVRTAGGRETRYSMDVLPSGDRRRTVQEPTGAKTVSLTQVDGTTVVTDPDGTRTTVDMGPDVRWGTRAPVVRDEVVETPGGKAVRTVREDRLTLRDEKDPLSVAELRTTFAESTPTPDEDDFEPAETSTWTYSAGDPANPDDQTVTATSAEGRVSVTTLDRHGRVTRQTLGQGVAPVQYAYDERGRVKSVAHGQQANTFAYDARHRLLSTTDAGANTVEYRYDDADRVTEKRLPGGRTYRYGYDDDGNVASLTTPRGKVHTFGSTAGDRPRSYAPPAAASEGPVADPARYLRTYTTERSLDSVKLPSGALQDSTYDPSGRLTDEDHVQSRRTFGYEGDRDQFATVGRELADGTRGQTIAYGYDGAMPKSLEFGGVAAGRYEYALGERQLPASETLKVGAAELTRQLAFDGDRLLTQSGPFAIERKGPGGAVSKITDGKLALSYEFDALGRPTGRRLTVDGTERFYQKLTFDAVGRAGAREEKVDGGALDTLTYGYDGIGQLETVKRGAQALETYAYDLDGNRTSGGAAYDDQDRLTTRAGIAHKWDADGFLVRRGSDTFAWSRGGELLTATAGGATVTYAYDAFGRRTARTDAGGTTKYLYGNPANMFQVTASTGPDGALSSYFYDGDDRLYAIERDGERYYVASDQIGSPRLVIRASDGSVVRRVDYDAYGIERDASGTFELPIGWAGGLRDAATGLVRFGMRDYDPAAGRWTARDPSFFAGSPDNLYGYANNNPVTNRDPSGLVCGGFSAYAVGGGGIQVCRDNKIDGADWSVCLEGGLGLGGGPEVDVLGGAADTGHSIVAEVTGKIGWAGGTLGGELDLNCFNGKLGAKVFAGPVQVGVDTGGGVGGGYGQNDGAFGPNGKIGAKLEGKLVWKGCKKF